MVYYGIDMDFFFVSITDSVFKQTASLSISYNIQQFFFYEGLLYQEGWNY